MDHGLDLFIQQDLSSPEILGDLLQAKRHSFEAVLFRLVVSIFLFLLDSTFFVTTTIASQPPLFSILTASTLRINSTIRFKKTQDCLFSFRGWRRDCINLDIIPVQFSLTLEWECLCVRILFLVYEIFFNEKNMLRTALRVGVIPHFSCY